MVIIFTLVRSHLYNKLQYENMMYFALTPQVIRTNDL